MSKRTRFCPAFPYRKLFLIATEGQKTEDGYFNLLSAIINAKNLAIHIECLKSKDRSAPKHVLKRVKDYIERNGLRDSDEAWVLVDKDKWDDEILNRLYNWSSTKDNYGFALSNPKFEYWLLLHFEDGNGIKTSRECSDRLKKYVQDYDKNISRKKCIISIDNVREAIKRSKLHDTPPCENWPQNVGTTVYKLVERILQANER